MKEFISKLMNRENLTNREAVAVMETVMAGEATGTQIGAFLIALRMKGETADEIASFAEVLRKKANRVETDGAAIDIVGTGGDGANTFNISTAAAFVTAAAGMKVAKHGNRAASSQCGTADVLEALGCNISLTPENAQKCIKETGICFLFAQAYHTSMKHVAEPRRELGVRTIFNLIGPLSNPAFVQYQLLGVASKDLVEPMAIALKNLGMVHAAVVHGEDGLDEITLGAETIVAEVQNGQMKNYRLRPEDFGLQRASISEMHGGDANENAAILKAVLSGEKGPRRDIVLFNAGMALYIADKAISIADGMEKAAFAIDSGKAIQILENYIMASHCKS